ncbi:hypothetical protein PVK06_033737 [Gossypium arboreum]|uniref:Uncharacterized protein n=1 Tax=Gossypium arboreum TaxID=29729 RepID=A0ABR0NC99_GOSAR|nr:hypothetical protein PVK06_033737 [Gossypium arboreum]
MHLSKGGPTGRKSILKELFKQRPRKAQVLVKKRRNLGSIEGRNQGEKQERRGFHYAFTAKDFTFREELLAQTRCSMQELQTAGTC